MIDDKKIEDAAKQHSEESYISDYFQACYKDAFMEGAKWAQKEFLKDLWHPNTEEPDKRKSDIITIGSYNYISLHFKESFIWKEESWRHSISRCQINKWAYLSDILPKQKGGNND